VSLAGDDRTSQIRDLAVELLAQYIPIPGIGAASKALIAAGEGEYASRGIKPSTTAVSLLGATPIGVAALDAFGIGVGDTCSPGDVDRMATRLDACQRALRASGIQVPLGSISGAALQVIERGLRYAVAQDRSARSVKTIREGDRLLRQAGYNGYLDPRIDQDGIGNPAFRKFQKTVREAF